MDENKIKLFDKYRKELQLRKDLLKEKQEHFNTENEELINDIQTKQKLLESIEDDIRNDAIYEYSKSGEKKFFGGIGIRVMKKHIYDEEQALTWAKEHKMCLSLDKTKFKKVAEAEKLDFVVIEDNPVATIPSKIKV